MEKIKVYKSGMFIAKFFLVFGIIFTLFAAAFVVKYLIAGFDTRFLEGNWSFVFFSFQGILFIIMGASALYGRKYFIEWDDNEIRYLLPGNKKPEVIRFDDIISVNIRLFQIEIMVSSGIKTIQLDNLRFEDLRKVKEIFENLK
mgnify:CR=1 FL=1